MAGPVGTNRSPRAPLTSFVGRDEHIEEIRAALRGDRLVSLLGVGGVGKSRLAAAVLADRRGETDEVAAVELASVLEPAYVAQAIHDAVDPHGNRQASLLDALADRRLLLVLDGCEHLAPQLRELLTDLLTRCPDLRILATSRVPLGVAGEHLIHVPPLSLARPTDGGLSAAARLFTDRARAVVGLLDPTDHDAVEELCGRLDGLPLAIELAAGRTRTMTVWEMLESITDWAEVLRPHPSAAEHRSLAAVLGWSWEHCTDSERQLWARLAVFAGPITLPAVVQVCGFPDQVAAADAVDRLVAQSLLLRERRDRTTTFRMLDTIAAFGRRSFTDGRPSAEPTFEQLRTRHARYFGELARGLGEDWLGPAQTELSRRTSTNIADFRAAFDHLVGSPDTVVLAADMYADLWPYWISRGRLRESRTWMRRLIDRGEPPPARALCIAGWTELVSGNTEVATRYLAESLRAERLDPRSDHLARTLLSACRSMTGDIDAATSEYRRSIEQVEAMGDDLIAALLWENYAEIAVVSGDLEQGREACARAQRICRAHGEQWILSWTLWVEALASYLEGDLDRAIRSVGEAWTLKVALDDLLGAAVVAEVAAWAYAGRGEVTTAATILAATTRYWTRTGGPLLGFPELLRHRGRCLSRISRSLTDSERTAAEQVGAGIGLFALVDHIRGAAESLVEVVGQRAGRTTQLLTAREREIAGYVQAGLTNKEIAQRLTVSSRTVEAHVSRILTKLGVARRSGIAAALS